eukprot:jgi/Chlat1/1255/Chrsp115S01663
MLGTAEAMVHTVLGSFPVERRIPGDVHGSENDIRDSRFNHRNYAVSKYLEVLRADRSDMIGIHTIPGLEATSVNR